MEDNSMTMIKTLAASALLASALSANPAVASEDKYPAYNFQPTVLFSNAELIEATHGAVATTPSAGGVTPAAIAAASAAATPADPKYPAAYFNPTVIYSAK
jgi:hypothetical protein